MPIESSAGLRGQAPSKYGISHSGEAMPRVQRAGTETRLGSLANVGTNEPYVTVVQQDVEAAGVAQEIVDG